LGVLLLAAAALPGWAVRWFSLPASQPRFALAVTGGVRETISIAIVEIAVFAGVLALLGRASRTVGGPCLAGCVAFGLLAGALVITAPGSWRLRANPSTPATFYASRPFFDERLKTVA